MKEGIFGGTFDPIHQGHLIVAEEVASGLGLEEVIFVPAGQPWMKSEQTVATAVDRVEMVKRAISSNPQFRLSTVELECSGPSYTVDTVAHLKSSLGDEVVFFFILGWDTLAGFPLWKEPARLVEMCKLVAVPRPGYSLPDLRSLEEAVPGFAGSIVLFEGSLIDIDSTRIRRRVAKGLSIHYLVPDSVEQYIRQHHLYTS